MNVDSLPLSYIVRRSEVGETGRPVVLEADDAARAALARHLGVPEVGEFTAQMTVEHWHGNGLVVRGQIDAQVVQSCVVTLEPVRNAVHESFEAFFAPRPDALGGEAEGPDPADVEPLIDQRVDAGALAVEHLVLALDPYPRCQGAAFEADAAAQEGETNKPFAALAALRKRGS